MRPTRALRGGTAPGTDAAEDGDGSIPNDMGVQNVGAVDHVVCTGGE